MLDPSDLRRKLEEGRATLVGGLRALADELERLEVPDAAEVMTWLAPHLERLHREAERIFGRS